MPIVTPLSASSRWIIGADGNRVKLAGVNWAGAHEDAMVPGGLDFLNRNTIAEQIAAWGFNSVRFPFALRTVTSTGPVDPSAITANADLAGMTSWQVYQACVAALTAAGLMVIPNCHMLYSGWPVPLTTQILTRSGWKHHHEVEPDIDQTLGRSSDGTLRWTPILRVQSKGQQKVVRFGSGRWSTICTPDHRWLVQQAYPRNDKPLEWGPVKTESAHQAWNSKNTPRGIAGARRLVLTGYAEGGKSECTPDEARLIAWILGDGNLTIRGNGSHQAYIAQSASKHAVEIRALVTRTGFLSSETTRQTGHGFEVCLFRLKNAMVRELWRYLDEGLIPFVLTLSQESRAAWLDAWRKAEGSDGTIAQNPGEQQEVIALSAFMEGYLPQRITGERHHGVRLMCSPDLPNAKTINNGPNADWIYEDAGTADVWCPTTGLGSWVAKDENGCIFLTGNCCSASDTNGLWWNANWPAGTFLSIWQQVATTFVGNPLVVGFDIKNEPRPATVSGHTYTPTWGDGNTQTDFRWLYQQAGDAILAINPNALIICEGTSNGGDLTGVAAHPVTLTVPNRVVYSIHDYPQGWPASESQTDYINAQHNSAGYVTVTGQPYTAPLWVGEFGLANDSMAAIGAGPMSYGTGIGAGPVSQTYGNWWSNFKAWAYTRADLDWCCWHLSGTHVQGTQPSTNTLQYNRGDRCWDGLYNQSWSGPANPAVIEALQAIQAPTMGPGVQ